MVVLGLGLWLLPTIKDTSDHQKKILPTIYGKNICGDLCIRLELLIVATSLPSICFHGDSFSLFLLACSQFYSLIFSSYILCGKNTRKTIGFRFRFRFRFEHMEHFNLVTRHFEIRPVNKDGNLCSYVMQAE